MTAQITAAKKPRLKNLDDLFRLNEDGVQQSASSIQALAGAAPDTVLAVIPFALMEDYPGHPFHLYEGERKQDMVDSIRDKGILQPLILRTLEYGGYQILSGHNRKYCGIEAGLEDAPAIVKSNLNDDEAWIYVIETNLMQRSFSDMSHSEKAAVISLQHSKLFSQGKRNDIIAELQMLEKPYGSWESTTSAEISQKLGTREALAQEYGLKPFCVAQYLRVHQLSTPMKQKLDSGEFALTTAVALSFLKEDEQQKLACCMELNKFKVDMRKADILRDYSAKDKLDEETIYLTLSGELGQPPKKNRAPTVKVSKAVYARYFKPSQPAKEVQDIVEKALEFYFSNMAGAEQMQD